MATGSLARRRIAGLLFPNCPTMWYADEVGISMVRGIRLMNGGGGLV
jgi:hypothetical protein